MQLKVGDKVYCIKNLGGEIRVIKKDNFYTIEEVTTYDKVSHTSFEKEKDINVILIHDKRLGRTAFTMERYNYCFYFYDYFITKKELRKRKLKKINGIY